MEQLVVSITADAQILDKVPTLARECKTLLFTSSEQCKSMEDWQRIFEANGFLFVRNTDNPSIRSMLFVSLHYG